MNLEQYKRVLKLTKKPDSIEFRRISLVTLAGVMIIGFIGFIILIGKQVLLL